jgi:hypothetical protein
MDNLLQFYGCSQLSLTERLAQSSITKHLVAPTAFHLIPKRASLFDACPVMINADVHQVFVFGPGRFPQGHSRKVRNNLPSLRFAKVAGGPFLECFGLWNGTVGDSYSPARMGSWK